jgi:hypothetical protein
VLVVQELNVFRTPIPKEPAGPRSPTPTCIVVRRATSLRSSATGCWRAARTPPRPAAGHRRDRARRHWRRRSPVLRGVSQFPPAPSAAPWRSHPARPVTAGVPARLRAVR